MAFGEYRRLRIRIGLPGSSQSRSVFFSSAPAVQENPCSGEHVITRDRYALPVLLLLLPAIVIDGYSQLRNSNPPGRAAETATASKGVFAARCANCHGLDGRGGERGPNIATSPRTRRLSDTELARVISSGRPNSGMPAFRLLGNAEIQRLVAYLRLLQGTGKGVALAGNPQRGKAIFFGEGDCASCHMIAGEGGFLASDLSSAQPLSPSAIRKSIVDHAAASARARVAVATTSDGQTWKGLVRNEDNFSVQIQSEDGAFHLFLKSELQKLEYQPQPLVPTNYGEKFSQQDLDDLVGYLQSVSSAPPFRKEEKE
jgi:cytochrome c oxidase cbb3-type subunit 3